jgi:hypothetical protein
MTDMTSFHPRLHGMPGRDGIEAATLWSLLADDLHPFDSVDKAIDPRDDGRPATR